MCLLIAELLLDLDPPWDDLVYGSQIAIWITFGLAFVLELSVAPRKLLYLRRNWILVVALIVPSLRVLRVARSLQFLRSARIVRGASVLRGFTSLNRAMVAIRNFLGFSQLAFLAALTGMVWLASSGLVYFLETNTNSEIDSVGDAMWWAASVLTTVGISMEPASTEGRIVAVALRVFGVAIIGYFTARMAAFFFGQQRDPTSDLAPEDILALRNEVASLRRELQAYRDSSR
jgi:voltage-gated potassium channel